MSRPLRIQFPGAFYHVTNRGNEKRDIFDNDKEKNMFLRLLGSVIGEFGWKCHTYCLMTNHYHLEIETPEGNLAAGMRQLNGVYTQRINRSRNRVGHLFQGRYDSQLIQKEGYFLNVCRYAVLNPVRAKIVSDPKEYCWSSYRATAGLVRKPPWLETDMIYSCLSISKTNAANEAGSCLRYASFVSEGIGMVSPLVRFGKAIVGDKKFIAEHLGLNSTASRERTTPLTQGVEPVGRPSLQQILDSEPPGRTGRRRAIIIAKLRYAYSTSQISSAYNVCRKTVSRIINGADASQIISEMSQIGT